MRSAGMSVFFFFSLIIFLYCRGFLLLLSFFFSFALSWFPPFPPEKKERGKEEKENTLSDKHVKASCHVA